ncbi:glycosyltransferase family 2 protein [Candidatus Gottesmanbacteria bacterium]|nr:glycosyltransferase family 2 protein [Candidatus Gottesmanbacteria bacterium]
MDLSIIIPSYNTQALLRQCLKSLMSNVKSQMLNVEIIVIDNGSTDGSAQMIEKEFPGVKLIKNPKNFGFAKAVNQGLEKASGRYLLLLNSDTVIQDGAIDKMVAFLENHLEVGVVGCQLKNPDGTIQPSGGYLANLVNVFWWMTFLDDLPIIRKIFPAYHVMDKDFYKKQRYLGWVTGAFFLTKREVFEKVGFFDEKMFMYVEEVDWCAWAKRAGYKVAFNPSACVIHFKGASTKRGKAGILEEYQGLKYFFKKHKPSWQTPILRIILKLGALARIFVFGIILKDLEAKRIYAKAYQSA